MNPCQDCIGAVHTHRSSSLAKIRLFLLFVVFAMPVDEIAIVLSKTPEEIKTPEELRQTLRSAGIRRRDWVKEEPWLESIRKSFCFRTFPTSLEKHCS